MIDKVKDLWPELEWIKGKDLREKTANTWALALEESVLNVEDRKSVV